MLLKGCGHGIKAGLTDQCAATIRETVAGAAASQVAEQCTGILVSDGQVIDIEYRICQSRTNGGVTDIMHVGKTIHMRARIGALPGLV